MRARFYAPDLDASTGRVRLSPEETRHLAGVLRLAAGAEVGVFDGRGGEWLARVGAVGRGVAELAIFEPATPPAPDRPVAVTLAQAVLRGDRMDEVVRDATMLGATRIIPLLTAHARASARPVDAPRALARWRRLAIASCKQCGRARLPEIRAPVGLDVFLDEASPGIRVTLVEPRGGIVAPSSVDELRDDAWEHGAAVLVGPEGGWSPDELHRFTAGGCRPWSLGAITLRADAIAVAALSVLYYAWRERG